MDNALVAVSGGSDSLALLDILHKENKYNLIVCHVNYHYRDSSTRDEQIVVNFCKQKNIKIYILNLDSRKEKEGNFEDWARVKRYRFFKEIYQKENCKCLFVGHQKDDVIETYIIQKNRGAIVECFGLAKETTIQGMRVVRPLLNYTKGELELYCKKNNIEFGIDETNFDLNYSRNKIRHEFIENLSNEDKNLLIKEIHEKNRDKISHVKEIKEIKKKCLISENIMNLDKFILLEENVQKEVLYYFLIDNIYKKISIKETRLIDIIKKINSSKPNIELAQYDDIILYKEYKFLVIEKNKKEYCYKIDEYRNIEEKSGYYISEVGKKLERVIATREQFPLYLKSYDGNDAKINRIFINKKIPLRKRKTWPVVVDKFGALLLVIGIKKFYNEVCDFNGNIIDFYICENKGE